MLGDPVTPPTPLPTTLPTVPHVPPVEEELREAAETLRGLVSDAVGPHPAETILLSGGLDTSILAEVARSRGLTAGVTVLVGDHPPDEEHAIAVAERCGLTHHVVRTDFPGLLREAPLVVRTMQTFDPMEVRNSLVVSRGLREAAERGLTQVLTGDAADELFGGYSFLWGKDEEEFRRASERMAHGMSFSSFPLGRSLGVRVQAPFMDPAIVRFSLTLPRSSKVRTVDGTTHGKYLLRLAFPEVPNRWRRKDPIEVGSGSAALRSFFEREIPPHEFERERARVLQEDGVRLRGPEHLAYYRVFRQEFGDGAPIARNGDDPCPACGYQLVSRETDFCRVCGEWPVRPRS